MKLPRRTPACLRKLGEKHQLYIKDDNGYGWAIIVLPNKKSISPSGVHESDRWGYVLFHLHRWRDSLSDYKSVYDVRDRRFDGREQVPQGFVGLVESVKRIDKVLSCYSPEELKEMVGGWVIYFDELIVN